MLNFEKADPSDIDLILTEIYYILQIGKYIIPFQGSDYPIYFSNLDLISLRELELLPRDNIDNFLKLMIERTFVGFGNKIINQKSFPFINKESPVVYTFIKDNKLDKSYLDYIIKINTIFNDLRLFVPTFCDTHQAKALWQWYKINASTRPFNGLNLVEQDFVFMMSLWDRDVLFENFKFLGSHWNKKTANIGSYVTRGFSWLHLYQKGGAPEQSVKEMEEMMERHIKGEKDEHEIFMDNYYKAQRDAATKYMEKVKKDRYEYTKHLDNMVDEWISVK